MTIPFLKVCRTIRRYSAKTLIVALVCFLAGCGGGGGSSITGRYGTLLFTAATDKSIYNSGETVNFVFTATNTGASSVSISGSGLETPGNEVPIVARVEKGGLLLRRLLNNNSVNGNWTVGPGETKTSRASWDQTDENSAQVPTGAYVLTVLLGAYQVDGATFTNQSDVLAAPPISIVIH